MNCPICEALNSNGSQFCGVCGTSLSTVTAAAMADGPISEPAPTERPAGFWDRLLAWTIDCFLLFVANLGILALLPGYSPADIFNDKPLPFWLNHSALFWGLSVPYETLGVRLFSTTVGKGILGIYVRRADGGKVGLAKALVRGMCVTLSRLTFAIGPIPVGLVATIFGLFSIGWASNRPGLHNQVCETTVVERVRGKGKR